MDNRVVIGLIGSLFMIGCGRLGFEDATAAGGDDDGTSLGSNQPCVESSVRLSENTDRAYIPKLMWNGTEAAIAWVEDSTPQALRFRTVSPDGKADPIASPGPTPGGEVDLGWDGAGWRLIWPGIGTNGEVMISSDGAAARTFAVTPGNDTVGDVAALSDGKIAYLWVASPSDTSVVLTVIDAAGNKLVNARSVVTGSTTVVLRSLVWTGSELAVFYSTRAKLMMVRLSPDGNQVTAPVTVGTFSDTFMFASATWAGDRFLVGWNSANGFRAGYVGLDGVLVHPAIGAAGSMQWTFGVTLAVGPTSDMIAWNDINGVSFIQEMLHDGTIGEVRSFTDAYYPSLAWIGKRWAIALSQRVYPTPASPEPKPDFINLTLLCSAAKP